MLQCFIVWSPRFRRNTQTEVNATKFHVCLSSGVHHHWLRLSEWLLHHWLIISFSHYIRLLREMGKCLMAYRQPSSKCVPWNRLSCVYNQYHVQMCLAGHSYNKTVKQYIWMKVQWGSLSWGGQRVVFQEYQVKSIISLSKSVIIINNRQG